ncbi:MAG: response regulator [Pseudomonadota bacterium]
MKLNNDTWADVFNSGPVCMFVWKNITGEWPVVKVTKNVEALTGWKDKNFLSGERNYAELIHADDLARIEAEEDAWKSAGGHDSVNMNYRIVDRDGEVRHVSEFTQSIWDDEGNISHLVGYILDVTSHHLTVEEKIAAQDADKTKSEFLASMSHEIRTPMNGVIGMAELLSGTQLDEKQRMFTDIIIKSGESLIGIINDILDFSKLDAGQMTLDLAPFDIAETVEDVATLYSANVEDKGLELISRVDPNLSQSLIGDAGRFRQIITNLMSNAVKFTEEGHVFINTKLVEGKNGSHQRVRVEVSDTGVGIPQEDLEKVFEKFSQVGACATRKHQGTGLGLSISTSLIRLMNGEIGVESDYGKGSRFWFEIELEEHEKMKNSVSSDISASSINRVLIVEDNDISRKILEERMEDWNFDCAAVETGNEAIAVARTAFQHNMHIDCMILDSTLPDMDGREVVNALRADSMTSKLPIVLLTSLKDSDNKEELSNLDIQGIVVKPPRSEVLRKVVADAISGTTQLITGVDMPQEQDRTPEKEPEELRDFGMFADDVPAKETENCESQTEERGTSVSNTNHLDVLLCEDNEVNQIVFTQILDEIGARYKIANNGKEGVEAFLEYSPSMILMDVSMPIMNGHEATREIRKLEAERNIGHTPIVAVTAHAIKGDSDKCFEAGMDDYLTKPVSPNLLTEKVHKWMEERKTVSSL